MADKTDKVRKRLHSLNVEIERLDQERTRLRNYLEVDEQFTRQMASPTIIGGKQIDEYCQRLLHELDIPVKPKDMVQLLADRYNVMIEKSATPAERIISTRLSISPAFVSTDEGWYLSGISINDARHIGNETKGGKTGPPE